MTRRGQILWEDERPTQNVRKHPQKTCETGSFDLRQQVHERSVWNSTFRGIGAIGRDGLSAPRYTGGRPAGWLDT